MTERPIIFSGPMVRAILEGRKTQTRRVVKRQKHPYGHWLSPDEVALEVRGGTGAIRSPYGCPGDKLWVREACQAHEQADGLDGVLYRADGAFRAIENTQTASDMWVEMNHYRFGTRGGMVRAQHMPRWASRITLEIMSVRVERLQEISNVDAQSEGIDVFIGGWWCPTETRAQEAGGTPEEGFMHWWNLNAKRGHGWETNPWVWVIEFRRSGNDT